MVTLDEFKKKHSDKCRLIGLDLGSKRIGVSICDEKQLIATPFRTIVKTSSEKLIICLLYTSPSPRDMRRSRMPSSA